MDNFCRGGWHSACKKENCDCECHKRMKLVYIAGPYRAKNGSTLRKNIREAEEQAVKAWKQGYAVICPHLNSAFMDGEMPDQTFLDGDIEILRRCDIIMMMPRWKESMGSIAEHDLAKKLGKEIIYL